MGNEGCGQSVTALLCCFFLHTLLPCSVGPLHGPQFLRGTSTCAGRGPPRLQRGCLLQWGPLQGLQGISALCLEHLLSSSFLPWCLQGCFSHFFSLLLTARQYVLSFLTRVFPEAPPSCLRGSAVPCGGFVGANWNWGSPGLSSQRSPLQHWPPPPCPTLPHKPNTMPNKSSKFDIKD